MAPAAPGKARSAEDHRHRVDRILSFIDEHLGEPLDLDALAGVACFSKFHFHRVFKAVMGMSPQEYLTRRRLERAYHFLVNAPDLSVSELAGLLGFSSSSNFSRAFRKQFSFRPRDLRSPAEDPFRGSWTGEGAQPFTAVEPERVSLEPVAPFKVLFVRGRGFPTDAVARPALAGLRAECARQGWSLAGAREIAVTRSVPALSGPAGPTFDLGVELPPTVTFDDPARVQTVGGGSHARYEHLGDPALLPRCWEELYSLWLRRSGLSVGSGFGFTVVAGGEPSAPGPRRFVLFLPLRGGGTGGA